MFMFELVLVLAAFSSLAHGNARVKRQDDDPEAVLRELCRATGPGEWFRLDIKDCRNVYQCTEGVLQALRCPHGLAFDLDQQTCDWKDNVKNCNDKYKVAKIKPLYNSLDCSENMLACGDGVCMDRSFFCDGKIDCADESDESLCDINNDPNAAPVCDEQCVLPDCYCYTNSHQTPNDMPPSEIPQMVMISFDDSVNQVNTDLYEYIFNNQRVNPNGCSIKATFFVSHKYTNYTAVQELHRQGHEIAVHSISHNDSEQFWTDATQEQWTNEMVGSREILENLADLAINQSILGVRAPYLRVGGNNQFRMMEDNYFVYDSTITAPLQNPPLWPYVLYYRMPHPCHGFGQKCPTRSFAIWEIVMNELDRREDPEIPEDLPGCAMVDSCFSNLPTGDQFYNFLVHNFNRHYLSNRAPLGLFFHSAFLKNNKDILDNFIKWLTQVLTEYNDVYFVSMTQTLLWIRDPKPINALQNYAAWQDICIPVGESFCGVTGENNCELGTEELPGETIRLATCQTCPNFYPWLLDHYGLGRVSAAI